MRRPDSREWYNAMVEEPNRIIEKKTWVLVDLPPGKQALGTKWVCKIKRDANNIFERYKARVVVKGYALIAGIEFDETFAPVVVRTNRVIPCITGYFGRNLYIRHVDCKNAFLNSDSDVEPYVLQLEGFIDQRYPHKLNKWFYGLKQSPIFYLLLCSVICDILGFTPLETDTSI
jgi:Reverse transcriptase (RNA-dependent DNA polymerase)